MYGKTTNGNRWASWKNVYMPCAIGGSLSCGITHALVTPLDLIKCRNQVNPQMYKTLAGGLYQIFKSNGLSGLYTGWAPTLMGYSLQGAGKFAFYEYFKTTLSDIVGPERAHQYRTCLYMVSSALAETIADVPLSPMEALKIKIQTGKSKFAPNSAEGLKKIYQSEGFNGFFKGIYPLWMRQVPYTIMKFTCFERSVESIYKYLLSRQRHEYNKFQQLGVTVGAGYWAGVFCAVASHPADTIVSRLNSLQKHQSHKITMSVLLRDIGFRGIWNGLRTRIVMVGTLTSLQWLIYDTFKIYYGLQTSSTHSGSVSPKTFK